VRVWRRGDGALMWSRRVDSARAPHVAIAAAGRYVVIAGHARDSQDVEVIDWRSERIVASWPGAPVSALAISADGGRVATWDGQRVEVRGVAGAVEQQG
jgi:hypothetical protein